MHTYQKYRASKKKQTQSIAALQRQLFHELQSVQNDSQIRKQSDNFFSEFQEHETEHHRSNRFNEQLLSRAKNLTYTNKNKIEKMRRQIKRLQKGEGDFMTGVGLFEKQTPVVQQTDVDGDAMLRNVTSNKFDDLEELRRMIKKTHQNKQVYKTQTKVVSAADKCGWDLDVGLAIKINRCNLDQVFGKQTKPKTPAPSGQIRRRTISSYNSRKTKL